MRDPKGPVKSYKSPEELAKKHKVPLSKIMRQVKIGTKVEGEHTTSQSGARITALQHVDEFPDYYDRLKKVEKSKSMKESTAEQQYKKDTKYCLLCRKNESREECSYGPQMWDRYTIAQIHPTNESKIHEDHKEIASGKKKDEEGYMARIEFDQIERSVNILRKLIKKGDQQLPAWVQSKITRAADFIDTAAEYLSSDEDVSEETVLEKRGLWDNIHARRKKGLPPKKPGQEGYPKTLNVEGSLTYKKFMQIAEVAAWQRKEGKNPSGGLNEKGRKSYERENPGSDLKAPQPEGGPRKRSFCARMSGMKKKLTSKKTANDPNSRINKSLRAWNC